MPRSCLFPEDCAFEELRTAAETLGWPLFVKPVRAGSSFGVSRVEEPAQLAPAVEAAFRHDGEILLEEAIPGFEVGCAVLGNRELTVGAVDEVELSRGFFNYTEKYTLQTSAIHCPARSPRKRQRRSGRRRRSSTGHWAAGDLPGWTCSSPPGGRLCSTR